MYKNKRSKNEVTDNSQKRKVAREKRKKIQKIKLAILVLLVLLAAVIIIFEMFFGKNAYNVVVGNNIVCVIDKTKITAEDIYNTAQASLSKDINTNVRFTDDIKLELIHAPSSQKVTAEYAITKVKESVNYEIEAGIIKVDNTIAAILETSTEANNLLESIKGKFAPENADVTKCSFEQKVEVIDGFVKSDEVLTFEEAYRKLTYTTEEDDIYTVVSGDALWSVANKFGMDTDELKEINSMTDDVIKIGQKLNIKKQVPFLTVKYNG